MRFDHCVEHIFKYFAVELDAGMATAFQSLEKVKKAWSDAMAAGTSEGSAPAAPKTLEHILKPLRDLLPDAKKLELEGFATQDWHVLSRSV